MQTIQQMLKQAAEDAGINFRNNYSGRGMYGKQCVGIVGDEQECMQVIANVIIDLYDASEDDTIDFRGTTEMLLCNQSRDSMGVDIIIYWPVLEPIEDSEEQELRQALSDAIDDL